MGSGECSSGKIEIDAISKDFLPPNRIERFIWAEKYFTNLDEYLKKYDLRRYGIK